MKILLDYTLSELNGILQSLGEQKYRATQLYNAILSGKDFASVTNLPNSLLDNLQNKGFVMQPLKITQKLKSKDKNIKLLYKLTDGNLIEGMLMMYKFGNTLCVSTQVGCKMNCAFCASGLNGFVRNLSAGEMLAQVVAVNEMLGGNATDRKITNVVLMGSGEPLDNFDNVSAFLKLLTADDGFNISVRNISVSTCGIPQKIELLADLGYAVTLCISLHAPNDEIRKTIMPIAKSYAIKSVLESARYYHTITNRRIIIEYVLIDGVNNSVKHAKELAELLANMPCHVNLIRLNEVKERGLKAPSVEQCESFLNTLYRYKVSATMRRSIGDDVDGACGQLRNKTLNEEGVATFKKPLANVSKNDNKKPFVNTTKNNTKKPIDNRQKLDTKKNYGFDAKKNFGKTSKTQDAVDKKPYASKPKASSKAKTPSKPLTSNQKLYNYGKNTTKGKSVGRKSF